MSVPRSRGGHTQDPPRPTKAELAKEARQERECERLAAMAREHAAMMARIRAKEQSNMVLGHVEDRSWFEDQFVEALATKWSGQPLTAHQRAFAELGLVGLAHAALVRRNRDTRRGRDGKLERLPHDAPRGEIMLAGMGQSDLPLHVENIGRKVINASFRASPVTYPLLSREQAFPDYKPTKVLNPASVPEPAEVNEHAELTEGVLEESGSTPIRLGRYGRLFSLTGYLFRNADEEAIAALLRSVGDRAATFQNRLWFDACLLPNNGLGPDMADAAPLFHSSHANVASGGALDATKLGEARALLRRQSHNGISLSLDAAVLLVAPEQESLAESLVAGLALAKPEAQRLRVLSDSNLPAPRWYLFASPERAPLFVHGGLLGDEGPQLTSRSGFASDGVEFRLALDFAAGATGAVAGAVTGAGA